MFDMITVNLTNIARSLPIWPPSGNGLTPLICEPENVNRESEQLYNRDSYTSFRLDNDMGLLDLSTFKWGKESVF